MITPINTSINAPSSIADPSVLACQATAVSNITTEGFPGARFHGGCQFVDEIEKLAIERANMWQKKPWRNVIL